MNTKKDLFNFIETSTNWVVNEKEIHIKMPLYIKAAYELWNTEIAGFGVLFLKIKDSQVDMRIHQNAVKKIEELYPCQAVLVFEKLDGRNTNSLIKKHIPFIIENKQIYMPFALVQMQTQHIKINQKIYNELTVDADTILIGYLDNKIFNGMMIKEISEITKRDIRAVSNALDILESFNFVNIEKVGKSKQVYFILKLEVYERLKENSKSPIKYTFYTHKVLDKENIVSGYSALSKYTSLIDESVKTIALSQKALKNMNIQELECDKDIATYKIEIWDREPSLFSYNNIINSLYLLRILKNIDDERTEYALEEIEKNILIKIKEDY
jgi:DNA-binding transcriptional regulator GbsR (MarR family)